MQLQLVNRLQATRLRKLGFDWKVKDIFIPATRRLMLEETMYEEEDWNRYDYTLSRPSIALSLEYMRLNYSCKYELIITDWKNITYKGGFMFRDMEEPIYTKTYKSRNRAESELLSRILSYKFDIITH
ncbi:MAG: hypothetical protein LUG18_10715 [Candidatus Azobacteroides sp.]|nr:hypothetical protein [Candidatus Azobacteroides sp.]